jgi:hypothetical protein
MRIFLQRATRAVIASPLMFPLLFTTPAHAAVGWQDLANTLLHIDGSSVQWDLTNDKGDKVASGVFMYMATDAAGNKVKGKVAIIR